MELPPNLGLRTINIAPFCEMTNHYQSTCLEFGIGMGRCQAPNPTRPMSWLPLIMFQILISLKRNLTCYSNSHTHSNMHLKASNMASSFPSLALIYHGIKHILPRAKTSQSRFKQACQDIEAPKLRYLIKHIHVHQLYHIRHTNQIHVHVIMHDLPYPTASQHLCINACSWYMHVHCIQAI